ncbi:pyridoxamine 5'-phosphate oxidase family protein [Labrenzia sp. DG1229]|uniref:pyridoxamine 5'-phosphate oxidase family protein n=1 Tax=Labrenzia sp. DG1229 TaxID=681847 RepID=UPI000490F43E|nr:pyridoxamine 5'-phosphate oxidase family protein [Labrenzia sp. DG1229]
MLTDEMQALVQNFSAAAVATVNEDGTPSVSPKATFVILDRQTLVFGNIRSPGTIRNLAHNPAIELCFTDILARRAVRIKGTATVMPRGEADPDIANAFEEYWAPYLENVRSFVKVSVSAAEMIVSPAYDIGLTEAELRATNLAKLNAIK